VVLFLPSTLSWNGLEFGIRFPRNVIQCPLSQSEIIP
jgi:hypothetical protein